MGIEQVCERIGFLLQVRMQQIEVVQAEMGGAVNQGMIEKVRLLLQEEGTIAERLQHLREEYEQFNPRTDVSPFPFAYYETLFTAVIELADTAAFTFQYAAQNLESLARVALYMNIKRIPISKYGECVLQDQSLMLKIEAMPLSAFGPVGCKIAHFYCFLSVGNAVKQMKDLIANQLFSLQQHFKVFGGDLSMGSEKFMKSLERHERRVQNYFLEACPSEEQWSAFLDKQRKEGDDDTFCQLIVIGEVRKDYYCVGQRQYPCSVETIANAYLEAYLSCKHERLLKDKTVHLQRVTNELHALAVITLPPCKRIHVFLHSRKEEAMIEMALRPILAGEAGEDKVYYLLMARMDKHKLDCPPWKLDPALAALLAHVHPPLP